MTETSNLLLKNSCSLLIKKRMFFVFLLFASALFSSQIFVSSDNALFISEDAQVYSNSGIIYPKPTTQDDIKVETFNNRKKTKNSQYVEGKKDLKSPVNGSGKNHKVEKVYQKYILKTSPTPLEFISRNSDFCVVPSLQQQTNADKQNYPDYNTKLPTNNSFKEFNTYSSVFIFQKANFSFFSRPPPHFLI